MNKLSFQSLVMSNRTLTNVFMSSVPASFWERMGQKNAIKTLEFAAKNVPAYRDFLARNKINYADIKTIEDFKKLPLIDKKSYILTNSLDQLCEGGTFDGVYSIERTSGSSGNPLFWPKIPNEDRIFPKYIEYAFVQFYGIDKKSTLVIITLAMGLWISGEKMSRALRQISMKGKHKLAVMSPGAEMNDTLEIVEKLGDKFEQIIIVGYPPFVKSVIDEGERRGIDWKRISVKIGLGGEGYSEHFRDYVAARIGLDESDFLGISGGYGTAELGMSVGREYPITVLIRKLASKDQDLAEDLFGEATVPSLLQYNPASCFVEEHKGDLIFTTQAGIPLIRYNIRDRGDVITFDETMHILKAHGYDVFSLLDERGYSNKDVWRLPFFYVFGRSDGTVTVSGQNVYPENIETVLYDRRAEKINAFKLSTVLDAEENEHFLILVELRPADVLSDEEKEKLQAEYQKLFLNRLLQVNKEYRYVYNARPRETAPVVKIFDFADGPFAPTDKIKRDYIFLPEVSAEGNESGAIYPNA